ncbi:hypothetical protein HJG60_010533 [Phyllostomus discolor]|uniref:Uncharacterized protein n=1 Tax=Phyllostomus discolor TaxID=89673 RepID=A0A834EEZ0_9CHIR|nr:hypothetical protein HJG60_010533 [Phyllostomus discolor]
MAAPAALGLLLSGFLRPLAPSAVAGATAVRPPRPGANASAVAFAIVLVDRGGSLPPPRVRRDSSSSRRCPAAAPPPRCCRLPPPPRRRSPRPAFPQEPGQGSREERAAAARSPTGVALRPGSR